MRWVVTLVAAVALLPGPSECCKGLSAAQIIGPVQRFSRVHGVKDPKGWKAAACPPEHSPTNCYYNFPEWGNLSEFTVLPGVCRPFSPFAFQRLLQCRNLVFIGDSVMFQHWEALVCMVPLEEANYTAINAHKSCVTFPNMRSSVCFFRDIKLVQAMQVLKLPFMKDAVVVVNAGLHQQSPGHLQAVLIPFFRAVKGENITASTIIWTETPPQHFQFSRTGQFRGVLMKNYTDCQPVHREVAFQRDWRNRVAEEHALRAGIPILRIWNISVEHWDLHVVHSKLDRSGAIDCTHWCIPGVPQGWSVALMDLLEQRRGVITKVVST